MVGVEFAVVAAPAWGSFDVDPKEGLDAVFRSAGVLGAWRPEGLARGVMSFVDMGAWYVEVDPRKLGS